MTPWFKIEGVRYELMAISQSDMADMMGNPKSRMAKIMGYPSFYDDSNPPRVWPLPVPGIRVVGLG